MKKLSFLIVLIILIVGGALAWWLNGITPVAPADKSQETFTVKIGEGVRAVANNLKQEELIKDPIIFFLVVKQLGIDQKIQAGDFFLSPSMSTIDIAKALQVGTNDVRVVIPEGKRAEEVADILRDRVDSYDESWRSELILNEGYLFPDTYSFPKDITIEEVISVMRDNFENKYSELPNNSNNLSKEEVVALASMLEREAKHDHDRPLVASVLLNRYRIGMKLDIDATIQYALGYQEDEKKWWKDGLTFDDLKLNSPYNTYLAPGLPPTPISNPGIQAISAIINPATTDYLFYLSDSEGNNHYARTNEEHEANKEKYGL